jgi:hypothetical protein
LGSPAYNSKPIIDNQGGMKAPHMFATWFMLKQLQPETIIESGVWKGQSTWLLEKTLPNAQLHCIDVKLSHRQFISDKANYYQQDFSTVDWSEIRNPDNVLMFFDDHQNAFDRVKQARVFGFKQFIFEDNYPAIQGDCYSLKKAFMHAGFTPEKRKPDTFRAWAANILKPQKIKEVVPNSEDSDYLQSNLDVYYEFPPVYKSEKTRWNDNWDETHYPTPEALLNQNSETQYSLFLDECIYYTWICYAKLK